MIPIQTPDPNDIAAWATAERVKADARRAAAEADALAREKEARMAALEAQIVADAQKAASGAERASYAGLSGTQATIAEVCDDIKEFLIEKNAQYGDSAIHPVRIFSKADPLDQLLVRIDDKLSRISRGDDRLESDADVLKVGSQSHE
jgi:hypothetical protein